MRHSRFAFAAAVLALLFACADRDNRYDNRAPAPVPTGTTPDAGTVRSAPKRTVTPPDRSEYDRGKDVREQGLTSDDQSEASSDLEITAAIRRAIVGDDSLSLNAHNVKIITREGYVTLRGAVASRGEKARLQAIAEKTRGVRRVDNQLQLSID